MLIPHLSVAGVIRSNYNSWCLCFIKKVSPGTIYEGLLTKTKPYLCINVLALICLSPLGLLATGTAWGEWGTDEISSVATGGKS